MNDDVLKKLKKSIQNRKFLKSGKIDIKGLEGSAKIDWDKYGVPHATVQTELDMWFIQGFLHAVDRLWGMERTRRFVKGTLSEIIGAGGLAPDKFFRRVGPMRAAEKEWDSLEKEGKNVIEAYANGVNAFIELGLPLPIEFELLNYVPAKWSPLDVTGRWKLIAHSQSLSGHAKISRLQMLQVLGIEKFKKIFPYYPVDAPVMVPMGELAGDMTINNLQSLFENAYSQIGFLQGTGSNNWAVDGTMTESGYPLLAGDPHLAVTVPCFWHVQHIIGPEFSFTGASMPGVPGVTYYGHNGHTAWSLTTAGVDAQDLYFEKIRDTKTPEYLFRNEWLPADKHEEHIYVKGQSEPVIETIYETHHGPIIQDPIGSSEYSISMNWSGKETQQTFSSFKAMHSSKNVNELVEAHRKWTTHTNRILADNGGNIAYILSGQVPIRSNNVPNLFPVPGWTGEHEWVGEIPFEEMPRQINPSNHYLNTSNNMIVSNDFPYYINATGTPYRGQRVKELLLKNNNHNLKTFSEIQMDTFSIPGLRLKKRLSLIKTTSENGEKTKALLNSWNGDLSSDSLGSIYEIVRWRIHVNILNPIRDAMLGVKPAEDSLRVHMTAIENLICENDNSIFDLDILPFENWDDCLIQCLDESGEFLTHKFGNDPENWKWGNIHNIIFRHGNGRKEPEASLLNVGPFSVPGSGDTICNFNHTSGPDFRATSMPSFRQIIDLSDFSKSVFIIPPGNSGDQSSPHYNDNVAKYFAGEYNPLLWNSDDIENNIESSQLINPSL
jgi:penicillin amidase